MTITVIDEVSDEEELEWKDAETIWNADRDNNGVGIKASKFIKILESLKRQDEQKRKAVKKSLSTRQR